MPLPTNLPALLADRLSRALPGRAAQARFEPELSYGRHFGAPPASARPSAVLLLLYEHQGGWYLPLTCRSLALGLHAGQISLPGGLVEPGETHATAARRELREELGIAHAPLEMLGQLSSLYLYVSNFAISPFVALAPNRPPFAPNPDEVREVLEIPLEALLDESHHGRHVRQQRGVEMTVPHIAWQEHQIWGATCMILGEFLQVVREALLPASKS